MKRLHITALRGNGMTTEYRTLEKPHMGSEPWVREEPWRSVMDDPPPMDGRRLLLSVRPNGGKPVTVIGGFDPHWSGNCWVYENPRIPTTTVPEWWLPLRALAQEGGE